MNSSKSEEISSQKITSLEGLQAEIFHPPRSGIMSSDNESSVVWSEGSYSETNSSVSNNYPPETPKDTKSTKNYDEQTKNKRIKCIVISIIILLSLGIIAMIISLIIVFKSTNTINKTETSVTTVSDITVTTNTLIIYDVGNGGASGDPPCSSHTVVNDPLRSINAYGTGGTCDNGPLFNTSIGGRWIRFIGAGGTIIPQTSPGISHCGAFIALWFNGTLPATIGTIASGDICYQAYSNFVCYFVTTALAVNCDGFFVYFLSPVSVCNARYCTT